MATSQPHEHRFASAASRLRSRSSQVGQYGNTSEYVRDLIPKDQQEQRVLRLRTLVEEGLSSGWPTADTASDWDELKAIARGDIA